jgi:hypothetical protein
MERGYFGQAIDFQPKWRDKPGADDAKLPVGVIRLMSEDSSLDQ